MVYYSFKYTGEFRAKMFKMCHSRALSRWFDLFRLSCINASKLIQQHAATHLSIVFHEYLGWSLFVAGAPCIFTFLYMVMYGIHWYTYIRTFTAHMTKSCSHVVMMQAPWSIWDCFAPVGELRNPPGKCCGSQLKIANQDGIRWFKYRNTIGISSACDILWHSKLRYPFPVRMRQHRSSSEKKNYVQSSQDPQPCLWAGELWPDPNGCRFRRPFINLNTELSFCQRWRRPHPMATHRQEIHVRHPRVVINNRGYELLTLQVVCFSRWEIHHLGNL